MNILIFLYNLILMYWSDALLIIVVAAGLAFLYRRGKKDLVKDIIYKFIVEAEVALGGATGGAKFSLVMANLYDALPLILRLLFSKSVLTKYIKDLVDVLKDKLKNPNITLLSYSQEAAMDVTNPLTLNIENQTNSRSQSIEELVEDLQYYIKQKDLHATSIDK